MCKFELMEHTIKIINNSNNPNPEYKTAGSSGMDLRAYLGDSVEIEPLSRALIKTGLFIEMDDTLECQVRPRSGLALKKGITVLNSPGTIDADYRGEIKVILINLGQEPFKVEKGLRIAQMVVCPIVQAHLKEVDDLSETERGKGGFGSTGTK